MTNNSNGSRQPCQEPEARPVTANATIIHQTTDMCQQAVRQLVWNCYDGIDLESYDETLVMAASRIDDALAIYDATPKGRDRDALAIDIGTLIDALADTSPPAPLDCLGPDDIDWAVEVEVSPDRIIASVLEALPSSEATILRTYLGGATDAARARLDAAIRAVAEGVVSRAVTTLWLPTRVACTLGIEVEDLAARLASEKMPLASASAVTAVEHAPDGDWVTTLAVTVERTALEVEGGNPAWGASLSSDALVMATVAARIYTTVLEGGVADAIATEELLSEQVESERCWDPDQLSSEAARAVVDVVRTRGVRVTYDMVLAGMTMGQLMHGIVDAKQQIELERQKPDLDRGYRRDAAKTAKKGRKASRKAQREARRRGRAS